MNIAEVVYKQKSIILLYSLESKNTKGTGHFANIGIDKR
jgi:hypothetical protein